MSITNNNTIPLYILSALKAENTFKNNFDDLVELAYQEYGDRIERKTATRQRNIESQIKDKPIADVIEFLLTLNPEHIFTVFWTGYEDCYLAIEYQEPETDKEYITRLWQAVFGPCDNKLTEIKNAKKDLRLRKSQLQKELKEISQKLRD